MTAGKLHTAFRELSVAPSAGSSYIRKRNRRKITHQNPPVQVASAGGQPRALYAKIETNDIQRVPEAVLKLYPTLNEDDQCDIWSDLASLSQTETDIVLRSMAGLVQLPSLRDGKRTRIHAVLAVATAARRSADTALPVSYTHLTLPTKRIV